MAEWALVGDELVVAICDPHAKNAAGAHDLRLPLPLAGGRFLPTCPRPIPIVFGGPRLGAALAAAAAAARPGRRNADRGRIL